MEEVGGGRWEEGGGRASWSVAGVASVVVAVVLAAGAGVIRAAIQPTMKQTFLLTKRNPREAKLQGGE